MIKVLLKANRQQQIFAFKFRVKNLKTPHTHTNTWRAAELIEDHRTVQASVIGSSLSLSLTATASLKHLANSEWEEPHFWLSNEKTQQGNGRKRRRHAEMRAESHEIDWRVSSSGDGILRFVLGVRRAEGPTFGRALARCWGPESGLQPSKRYLLFLGLLLLCL